MHAAVSPTYKAGHLVLVCGGGQTKLDIFSGAVFGHRTVSDSSGHGRERVLSD